MLSFIEVVDNGSRLDEKTPWTESELSDEARALGAIVVQAFNVNIEPYTIFEVLYRIYGPNPKISKLFLLIVDSGIQDDDLIDTF